MMGKLLKLLRWPFLHPIERAMVDAFAAESELLEGITVVRYSPMAGRVEKAEIKRSRRGVSVYRCSAQNQSTLDETTSTMTLETFESCVRELNDSEFRQSARSIRGVKDGTNYLVFWGNRKSITRLFVRNPNRVDRVSRLLDTLLPSCDPPPSSAPQ